MQTNLNPNRKAAKELIDQVENIAEAMADLETEAAQLAADPLSADDVKELAEKIRNAARAFLEALGLVT